ncbi:MAG: methyl-accepting chemotaxis protein [Clostridium sp.]|nr:methyl-accepting chemotaxis protein [Clostridium sp.]
MYKNLKISKKLITAFIIISIIASLSGMAGLYILSRTNRDYSRVLVENGFVQGDLGRFSKDLNRGAALVRDMIYLTDEQELKNTKDELEELRLDTNDALAAFRVNCTTPEEQEYIAAIDRNLPLYQEKRQEAIDMGLANRNEEALTVFRKEASPYLDQCLDAIQSLIDLNNKLGNEASARMHSQFVIFVAAIICLIIAGLALSAVLGTYIARLISRPIQACSDRLVLLSKGDFKSPVPIPDSTDETGIMLSSMNHMVEVTQKIIEDIDSVLGRIADGDLTVQTSAEYIGDFQMIKRSILSIRDSLNNTMGDIDRAAEQVSSGSDQVSSGAQTLSQGAAEQSSSVEELAATINEASAGIKKSAENAVEVSGMVSEVGQQVTQSNEQMKRMMEAMENISDSSNKIGNIIKTIEDIAFQTNILALNAAVEAARAGEAGKGFAVVADEVRNLAGKSAEASKNTSELIEASVHAVENGQVIAKETAGTLMTVVEGSGKIIERIQDIAEKSELQARSIGQITIGIDQISAVVQSNSATAEESAAASQELSGQAQVLKELVSRFRLSE